MDSIDIVVCLGCLMELEADGYQPEPLCAKCKQDNYLVHEDGVFHLFANSGQPHRNIPGVVSMAKFRRVKARRKSKLARGGEIKLTNKGLDPDAS